MKVLLTISFTLLLTYRFYRLDANPVNPIPDSTVINGRAMPSPLPSPPFPFADWVGPVIGEPGSLPDYLSQAIQKASKKNFDKWNKIGIKIYGWVDLGVNASTSKQANTPQSYDFIPNHLVLDQAVLMLERDPDMVQTKKVDWGFIANGIFGTDYRFTKAKGNFSDQLLKYNHIYGWDPTQYYGMIYIPQVAQGMLIKIGRYISPSDIEAQWAPQNYIYSHSMTFAVDPYTYTGVNATIRLHPQFLFEVGLHAGGDLAPWANAAQPNGTLMLRWVSKDNNESVWGGLSSIGRGKYKYGSDDLQQFVFVWGHRFNKTFHMMTEAYYMWQFDAAKGGSAINGPVRYGQGGGEGVIIHGRSESIGMVNYFQILCGPKDYLSIRNDGLNDVQGQRTGFATWYTDHTISWTHHFTDFIIIRPELRYDHAWNNTGVTPYDNGSKVYQFTGAVDLVVSF